VPLRVIGVCLSLNRFKPCGELVVDLVDLSIIKKVFCEDWNGVYDHLQ
jgi:hypothetical protein